MATTALCNLTSSQDTLRTLLQKQAQGESLSEAELDYIRRYVALRGEFKADSIWGSITGFSSDITIIDDYFKGRDEADSKLLRDKLWHNFYGVMQARSQIDTSILVFATPWHNDDLIGRLEYYNTNLRLEGAPAWEIIEFPAQLLQEPNNDYDIRHLGDFLWGAKKHLYLEAMANPKTWNAEYMLRPLNEAGIAFQRDWFNVYSRKPESFTKIIVSVDTNFDKHAKKGDKCAITVWGESQRNYYLLEFLNKRLNFVETVSEVVRLCFKYPNYWCVLIELKANGAALRDLLRSRLTKINDFDPKNNTKLQRAEAVIPLFYEGRIYIPDAGLYPEIATYLNQMLSFTGTQNNEEDDLVDATTQALIHLRRINTVPIDAPFYELKSDFYQLLYSQTNQLQQALYGK